jgi:hypothetical protein
VQLTPGTRFRSTACETEVIVTRAPEGDVELSCGGARMVPLDDTTTPTAALDPSVADGTLMGKRYVDERGDVEVLCTKAGAGALAVDGTPLAVRSAKPLPSSD